MPFVVRERKNNSKLPFYWRIFVYRIDTMKVIAKNKRAYHDYAIEDTYSAGIVLL